MKPPSIITICIISHEKYRIKHIIALVLLISLYYDMFLVSNKTDSISLLVGIDPSNISPFKFSTINILYLLLLQS